MALLILVLVGEPPAKEVDETDPEVGSRVELTNRVVFAFVVLLLGIE